MKGSAHFGIIIGIITKRTFANAMSKISVLTLTRNRTPHLRNLLKGLARSSRLPDECVVIHMNEPAEPVQNLPFPCRHYTYQSDASTLPLAQARNDAAAKATSDILLFLDVDCIPSEDMVEAYARSMEQAPDTITMGSVRYLQKALGVAWTEPVLLSQSRPHPKRDISPVAPLIEEPDYGLFWSLSFCLKREIFEQLGRFSECYPSYGAEDTDFAWKARSRGIPLLWVPDALSFHQYHHSETPPWNNFYSIVYNAKIFRRRWGHWPMESWLSVFAKEGYLDWTIEGDRIDILQVPAAAQSPQQT